MYLSSVTYARHVRELLCSNIDDLAQKASKEHIARERLRKFEPRRIYTLCTAARTGQPL